MWNDHSLYRYVVNRLLSGEMITLCVGMFLTDHFQVEKSPHCVALLLTDSFQMDIHSLCSFLLSDTSK